MNMESRIERLRTLLSERELDAVLVTKEVNLHYFSGFRGDSTVLIVTADHLTLVTDSRYTEQAAEEASAFEVVEQTEGLYQKAAALLKEYRVKTVGFEGNVLTYSAYMQLKELLAGIAFETALNLDVLRQVKDADEIACIRRACEIADAAFAHIVTYIRPGVTGVTVDEVARDVLRARNLNQYFGHGLGHSLGLEIHEEPRLSKFGKDMLRANMLITDEPGVYIPGWGGIRIEDTVLVMATGSEALTHAPKEFIEICI